ncbi:DUF721 domain-containing protein [Salegentibacter sp. Hel_I_6]|uniref:DUF721 domain-containing protein n=1 Tax=Salegentibacter sp. Hel_I_6 TaxID=1250278 RepID=UPI0005611DED|nr:DUF721 domain-containing protein [Salegentibacter sp. Hel_I_6]
MNKRNSENQSLSEVLQEFVDRNKLQGGLDKISVKDVWYREMGPAIQKYTTGIKLQNDTLFVQLSSSVLREELSYGKEKIIAMLNRELGKDLIKKLVLR